MSQREDVLQRLNALAEAAFKSRSGTHGRSASKKEDKRLFGDNQRQENLKQALHQIVIWAVRIAGIAMIVLFIIRIYHLAAPADPPWTWLDPERLQKIDSLLFSSFLGAFISRYLHQALPQISDKTVDIKPGNIL